MKNYRFHTINILGRAHAKRLLEKIYSTGLTSSQWPIIAHLLFYGESTQVKISEQLAIEPPTISKALRNMEMMGWISRIVDPDDKRKIKVILTTKAKRTVPIWLKVIDDLQEQVLKGISAEELEVFDRVLERLFENLNKEHLSQDKKEG
ncbi:MAG: transcriptional regulator SlyA [Firmicutes bacterium]|nr:transcriptional regulator SlyA [Bacillota bacterium]